ncbi:unknown [Acetobacter sp. CAG:267]|nr:unknown [Acetobacter sp. CAG:267]
MSFFNQINHFLQIGIMYGFYFNIDSSKAVNSSCHNFVADGFVNRKGFSGNGSLVNRSIALDDNAVSRNSFSRKYSENIAADYILQMNLLLTGCRKFAPGCRRKRQ